MTKELNQENFLTACKSFAPSTFEASFNLQKGEFLVITKTKTDAKKIAQYISMVGKKQAIINEKHEFGDPIYIESTDTFDIPTKKIGYSVFLKLS